MKQRQGSSHRKFKITVINTLRDLMGKADHVKNRWVM